MNLSRFSWWQCGLIGGITFSFATLIKASRSIPRLFRGDEEWIELPRFAIAVFAVGFVCGALVGILRRSSTLRGSAADGLIGVPAMNASPRSRRIQFGTRGLLIAVALCAAALGMGRWVWIFVYDVPDLKVVVQATEARGWMAPALNGREILVGDMNAYRKAKPARWEVVVFCPPRKPAKPNTYWLLRVIGLPGETVSFSEGKVLIDGQPIDPPSSVPSGSGVHVALDLQRVRYHNDISDVPVVPHPYTVPDGCYYVLGDNPDAANDSRKWGALPEAEILGRYPAQTSEPDRAWLKIYVAILMVFAALSGLFLSWRSRRTAKARGDNPFPLDPSSDEEEGDNPL